MRTSSGVDRRALLLGALVLAWAPAARADGQPAGKVEVMVQTVHASTLGTVLEPPSLRAMKEAFSKNTKYTSFKQLSLEKVVVTASPVELKLANGKTASLKLEELKGGSAKVRVKLPPLDTVYTLGREGSLYIAGGAHDSGDLWLVLSAIDAARPKSPHPASPVP